MTNKFGLKTKLVLLCLFMSVILVVVGSISYIGFQNTSQSYEVVTGDVLPKSKYIDEMFLHFRNIRISLRSVSLPGVTKVQGEKFIAEVIQYINAYEETQKKYNALPFSDEEKKLNSELESTWVGFKKIGGEVIENYRAGTEAGKKLWAQ